MSRLNVVMFAAMLVAGTPVGANDFLTGVVHDAVGCPVVGDLHRLADLLRAGDRAVQALLKLHCRGIPNGTTVAVENISPPDYEVCVTPVGSTEACLWIGRETLNLRH
jgi:hypothetical protein